MHNKIKIKKHQARLNLFEGNAKRSISAVFSRSGLIVQTEKQCLH